MTYAFINQLLGTGIQKYKMAPNTTGFCLYNAAMLASILQI